MDPKDGETPEGGFNSLMKLASSNFPKFAVAFQQMSAEAQVKLIEQLPEFRELATKAVNSISSSYKATLKADRRSEDRVHEGYDQWRAALIGILDDPGLSLDDKLRITKQIGEATEAQQKLVADGRRARAEMLRNVTVAVVAVPVLLVAAVVGGKAYFDQAGGEDA